jgi:hypothetical protein
MKSLKSLLSKSIKLAIITVVITEFFVGGLANARVPDLECNSPQELGKVKKKKSKIKTFVSEYWRTAESKIKGYPAELQAKGYVVGDPHLENVDVFLNTRSKTNPIQLTFNDLDEAGHNYLLGDLLKYISYLQSLKKQSLDLKRIIAKYSDGLNGKPATIPAELEALLRMTPDEYKKAERKYVSKQRIKGVQLAMTKISKEEQDMLAALRNMKVIQNLSEVEAWTDQNSKGSSAGMTRYLFYGKNQVVGSDGKLQPIGVEGIIEYKELSCTAAGDALKQNLESDLEAFVEHDARFLDLPIEQSFLGRQAVIYINNQHFLARSKSPGLYKDIGVESASPALVQTHGEYLAWFLGKFHRENATVGYRESVLSQMDFLIAESIAISKAFTSPATN